MHSQARSLGECHHVPIGLGHCASRCRSSPRKVWIGNALVPDRSGASGGLGLRSTVTIGPVANLSPAGLTMLAHGASFLAARSFRTSRTNEPKSVPAAAPAISQNRVAITHVSTIATPPATAVVIMAMS